MSKQLYENIIDLAQTSNELYRQETQHNRMLVYVDNFEQLVLQKIKLQFHPDNFDRLYKMVATYFNILKKIVNLKSIHYKQEAVRQWVKPDDTTIDDRYEELLNESNIHLAYQALNRYMNVNNTSFMRVMPDLQNKTIKYEAVPSENIIILRNIDDPFKIDALLHKIVLGSQGNFWIYWDHEVTGYVSYDFEDFYNEQENVWKDPNHNNKGIIPYVPAWAFQPIANSFWNETINDDLYNATIQSNVHLTHFNNLMKTSCYKQWVFTGMIAEDIKRLYGHVTDSLNPIALTGESSDAKADTFVSDLDKFFSTLHDMTAQVLDQHGVEYSSQVKSAQQASAMSLTIKKEALDDLRQEQQPLLRTVEKEVAYQSVIIANHEYNTGIDINGKLTISFAKENITFTPDDIGYHDWLTTEGYKSKKEIFMKLNPDVDIDQVDELLQANIDYNKQFSAEGTIDDEIDTVFNAEQDIEE